MLIINEVNRSYSISSLSQEISIDRFWGFSATIKDFVLFPLLYLEQYQGPCVDVVINDEHLYIPINWNIFIADQETTYVDVVPLNQIMGTDFKAFLFCPEKTKALYQPFDIVGIEKDKTVIFPSIQRGMSIVVPVGTIEDDKLCGIIITPYEPLGKEHQTTVADMLW